MQLFLSVYLGIVGLCVGSFLLVVIDRLPRGASLLWGRSQCDFCKKKLSWIELIPVISFLLQRGRCRFCNKRLSFAYPFTELLSGAIFFLIGWYVYLNLPLLLAALVIASSLLVIFFIDLKHFLIPDSAILIALLAQTTYTIYTAPEEILLRVLVGVCSFLFLGSIWFITKGKGMGFGDVKLAFFLGFSLSFPAIIVGYYVAFLTGAILGIILILVRKKSAKTKIPFGPFLIWGYIVSLFYSETILAFFRF